MKHPIHGRVRSFVGAGVVVAMIVGAMAAPAGAGGRPFTVAMTGAAERPGPGDPDGSGVAELTLNQGRGEICFRLEVENIALPAVGAHIHKGPATAAGPVVVGLTPPDESGTSAGCVRAAKELVKEIRQHPERFYVNVHTTEFPGGAIRGQLGD